MPTILNFESTIEASVEKLYPFFADVIQFGALHPLIKEVTLLEENFYLINEPINLIGSLSLPNSYKAKVIALPGEVKYDVHLPAGVHLLIAFSLQPTSATQTIVKEEVHIKGFLPLRFVLGKMIQKYHQMIHDALIKCYHEKLV